MTAGTMDGVPGDVCKLISAVVADDGTDLAILQGLRKEKGIVQAFSHACLGSSITVEARTKRGRLPEPKMVRFVEIVVPESRASEVFEYVCSVARVDQAGHGVVWQAGSTFCTPYALPEDVPDEVS